MLARTARLALGPALALTAWGCADEPPPAPPALRPVRTVVVEPSPAAREAVYAGVAEASVESRLSFRVPGSLVAVPVRVGDRIGAGDLVAHLDDTDYRLEIERAQAALDQATANRVAAEANFERVQLLYENDNASRNDYDTALAQREAAIAGVESAQTQLQIGQQRLGYTRLTSAMAGAIAAVDVEVNENVNAGQPIATIVSGSTPEVRVSIPEVLIGQIRSGDVVSVRFDAFPGRSYDASVSEVGIASARRATTFPVTVRVREQIPEVRSGMAAEVVFAIPTEAAFLLPSAAVVEDREGRFVFVVDASGDGTGTVRRRPVEVGGFRGSGIEIVAGIASGDRVVSAGARRLVDGQQVRVTGS